MANKNESEKKLWATKKDVAMHLKCSLRTIENWIAKGLLISYRFGGRVFLDLNEVDQAVFNSNKSSKK
jgi:excisionase family DNA binding protein